MITGGSYLAVIGSGTPVKSLDNLIR